MAIIAVGPEFAIDGPLPARRPYGLVDSTLVTVPAPAVAEDIGAERWANGICVHGYLDEVAQGWGVCNDEMSPGEKDGQQNPVPLPCFGPLTVYVAETCSSPYIRTYDDFKARADIVLAAVESAAVAREFVMGEWVPGNPHLGDTNLVQPLGSTPTSVIDGIAILEDAIAETGRGGVIHIPPSVAWAITAIGGRDALNPVNGKLYTANGTLVIPDAGYAGVYPEGESAPDLGETWIFATGPVETLRTAQIEQTPATVSEALDRLNNTVEYRAERYYIPFWDTALQVGVLVDRCLAECGRPS
jgi:hypothetical protein